MVRSLLSLYLFSLLLLVQKYRLKGVKNKKKMKKQRRDETITANDAIGNTFRNIIPAINNRLDDDNNLEDKD